jgi:hypothetical protein
VTSSDSPVSSILRYRSEDVHTDAVTTREQENVLLMEGGAYEDHTISTNSANQTTCVKIDRVSFQINCPFAVPFLPLS